MARVLVIAPHMDDEVLGCGGAIAKHVASGDEVHVAIVCHRVYDRSYDAKANEVERNNVEAARRVLGYARAWFLDLPDERLYAHFQEILTPLERVISQVRPEIAYIPFAGDLHQDHRSVAHAANIALRAIGASFTRRVLVYEVPSATEQSFPGTVHEFKPNYYVDISAQLDLKLAAMAAYDRESRPFPHPRSREMLAARAHVRGAACGAAAAEAFMLAREIA